MERVDLLFEFYWLYPSISVEIASYAFIFTFGAPFYFIWLVFSRQKKNSYKQHSINISYACTKFQVSKI